MSNEFTGFTAQSSLQEVIEGVETKGSNAVISLAALNRGTTEQGQQNAKAGEIPREGGKPTDYLGLAVFKAAKLVGTLNMDEDKALHMLRGDFEIADANMMDPMEPDMPIGFRLIQAEKPQIKVDIKEDPVRVDIRIKLDAHLTTELGQTDYTQPENRKKLEEALGQEIGGWIDGVIYRSQSEFDADICEIGKHAVKQKFPTWQEWYNYDWPEKFSRAEITVTTEVRIKWLGFQTSPSREAH